MLCSAVPVESSSLTDTAVGTIIDNDVDCIDPTDTAETPPTLTIGNETSEESANDLVFTATLSKAFCADASLEAVTSGGTATGGVDYVVWDDDSVTVPAYHTELKWGIQVLPDTLVEADETFNLSVGWASTMPPQYQGQPRVVATGTITDDDGDAQGVGERSRQGAGGCGDQLHRVARQGRRSRRDRSVRHQRRHRHRGQRLQRHLGHRHHSRGRHLGGDPRADAHRHRGHRGRRDLPTSC